MDAGIKAVEEKQVIEQMNTLRNQLSTLEQETEKLIAGIAPLLSEPQDIGKLGKEAKGVCILADEIRDVAWRTEGVVIRIVDAASRLQI